MGDDLGGPGNLNPRASQVTLFLCFVVGMAATVVFMLTGSRFAGVISGLLAAFCLTTIGYRMGQQSQDGNDSSQQ
jgi:uncharacterized membrane protein YjjB (DUF3815 family)